MPQVFHGMSTDVTVQESSTLRLSSLGSYPAFLYTSLNMLESSIIERYWSHTARLKNIPAPSVEPTRPARLRVSGSTTEHILSSRPPAFRQAPKHMAQSMSQMVLSMPCMPRVATRALTAALPVSTSVGP